MPNLLSDTTPLSDTRSATVLGRARAVVTDRLVRLYQEAGKFGAVGIVALAIELSVFNACLGAGINAMLAQVVSTVIAASAAFAGNRYWTWRDRPRTGLRREYLLYFFFNAIGLLIGLACLYASRDLLGQFWPAIFRTVLADNVAAKGVGMALAMAFRFWAYRRWVFPETAPASAALHIPLPDLALLEVDTALGVANSTVGISQ